MKALVFNLDASHELVDITTNLTDFIEGQYQNDWVDHVFILNKKLSTTCEIHFVDEKKVVFRGLYGDRMPVKEKKQVFKFVTSHLDANQVHFNVYFD